MATKESEYVSGQYQMLFEESLANVGGVKMDYKKLEEAIEHIKREHAPGRYLDSAELLRSVANGEFPFIILVESLELLSKPVNYSQSPSPIDIPVKISFAPDPLQVKIISNGEEVSEVMSEWGRINTNLTDKELLGELHTYVKGYLTLPIKNPDSDFKPRTIAIARVIHPSMNIGGESTLSFGYPYAKQLRQIEMGMAQGLRQQK